MHLAIQEHEIKDGAWPFLELKIMYLKIRHNRKLFCNFSFGLWKLGEGGLLISDGETG